MCVIITTPGLRHRPTLEQLELCEETNPHGSGVAWLTGKRVEYIKGLRAGEIHSLLNKVVSPAIVHFRIASVGGVNAQLCHPFPITHRAELRRNGRARAVLFHNGTWSEWSAAADHFGIAFPKREAVSDTRVAAALVARFGFDWMKRWEYCRWAVLSAAGIQRLGQWTRIGRCYYSNTYWRRTNPNGWSAKDEADWWKEIE